MKKIQLSIILFIFILFQKIEFQSQTTTIDYSWGATQGKLTRTFVIKNGNRVLNGPFSYIGKENSPSTMTVKANLKNALWDGPFSMSWICPSSDGFTFTASGKFSSDTMDGLWNFVVKGYNEGVKINKKIALTFNRGTVIKGEINNLIDKSNKKFNCNKNGILHGVSSWKGYENGFLIEYKETFVHGVKTIESEKDVVSGQYLVEPKLLCDTSIINERYFSPESNTFSKDGMTYELFDGKYSIYYIFTDSYLGYFRSGSNGKYSVYGSGYADFIETEEITLPVYYDIRLKQ